MNPLLPRLVYCFAALTTALITPSSLRAQTVVNYNGPAADTYVSVSAGDTNYGSETTWRTRYGANSSSQRLGYVRFDLDDRLTTEVLSATLSVTYAGRTNAEGTSATISVYGLNQNYVPADGKLGLNWGETQLTNNNAPWAASGSGTVPAFVTLLGTFTISVDPAAAVGTTYSITGTALASFLDTFRSSGENNVTFIFRSSEGTFFSFASKENTTYAAPSLSLVLASVPEPASGALLAGGFALMLGVRRRPRCRR